MKNKSFNAPFHNSKEKIKRKYAIVMGKKKLIKSCHRISLVIKVKNMVHVLWGKRIKKTIIIIIIIRVEEALKSFTYNTCNQKNTMHMGKDYDNNLIKYFLYLNIQIIGDKLWLKRIKKHRHTHIYTYKWLRNFNISSSLSIVGQCFCFYI